MTTLGNAANALNKIRKRIDTTAQKAGRCPSDITLIGAGKRQSHELIREFHLAGLKDVGENYVQEALGKRTSLADLTLNWHFIGQVQSNKCSLIADNFSWVHGIDTLKHAQRLGSITSSKTPSGVPHDAATSNTRRSNLNVLLQLNLDDEPSKGGVVANQVLPLSAQIAEIDGISLRGFMLIPKARDSQIEQKDIFAQAKELLEQTNQRYGLTMDNLSMGMSGDLEAAIMEGSTMVRIGTDLFGART